MRILHTADWHIGKRLYREDLHADHTLFFQWLTDYIAQHQVDVLLLSGDVFDLANPSADARKQYYEALVAFSKLNCRILITGGNHDSPAVLNAPRVLLQAMEISVIGGMPEDPRELIFPVKDEAGDVACVVAAVPYLRDADLRQAGAGIDDRLEQVREGISQVFQQAAATCIQLYPDVPAVAMGHLFAHGASTSDSEREVQVGNLAGFEAQYFPRYFSYIALGHIHKPQMVAGSTTLRYSGSPLPLSFSEREDPKQLVQIDIHNQQVQVTSVPVPAFRKLWRIQGSLAELKKHLNEAPEPDNPLPTLVELLMEEEQYNPDKVVLLEDFIEQFDHPQIKIIKHRVAFKNRLQGAHQLYDSTRIDELTPADVFSRRLEQEEIAPEQKQALQHAFAAIVEQIEQ
ncbi:MAG: exonuclease SbcCD subunit D C-terminal domain-containing protein [Bacteroidales bacterium]